MNSTTDLVLQRTITRVIIGQFLLCIMMALPADSAAQVQKDKTTSDIGSKQDHQTVRPTKTDLLGDLLPPDALLRMGTNRFCPRGSSSVVLSVDEQIVATQSGKLIEAWDATTGKLLWSKTANVTRSGLGGLASYGYRPFCLMPQSGKLVTIADSGGLEFWDLKTGDSESLQTESKGKFKSIDVSPDGSMFALGGEKNLFVCDRSGKEIFQIENRPEKPIARNGPGRSDRLTFGGEYSYARFTPDGKTLALVNSESPMTIQVLDATTGEVKREIKTKGKVVRFDFSANSRHVATTERDIAARCYDLESGESVWERIFSVPGLDERYTSDLQYSPSGDLIAVATAIGEDQRIQLLDAKTGAGVGALEGHTWKPWSLQFTRDGKQMYSCGWDKVIRRWDIEKREQIRVKNSERASGVCRFAPNGRSIAFCDDSGKLHIVDTATGKKIKTLEFPGAGNAQLSYSQDSQLLAGGGASDDDLHVYIWDTKDFEVKHHWQWPKGRDVHSSIEAMNFSRDANRLGVAVFRQSSCYVFDLPSDTQIVKMAHRSVYGMCMSPDGQTFVSGGWDKMLQLWDCETNESINTVEVGAPAAAQLGGAPDTRMYGALFSPDGKTIATIGMSRDLRIWNLDLEEINHFSMDANVTYGSFEFSRNGLWLAVGHSGGRAAIYDVQSGETVWSNAGHQDTIYNIDFGADDRTLLTGGGDGVCYLWDLAGTFNSDSMDVEKLAADLIGPTAKGAFVAHQRLGADPAQAVPAIRATLESLFDSWGEPDDQELANLNNRVRRAAMLLAEMDIAAAGDLLDRLLKASPNLAVKKTLFLATKQRTRFLERIAENDGGER